MRPGEEGGQESDLLAAALPHSGEKSGGVCIYCVKNPKKMCTPVSVCECMKTNLLPSIQCTLEVMHFNLNDFLSLYTKLHNNIGWFFFFFFHKRQ